MKMYKKELTLGDSEKTAIVINVDSIENNKKMVDCIHHILLLDRSGSMSNNMGRLVENVKSAIDEIADNDFVSVLWFNSENSCEAVVKAAKKDESIKLLVDTINSAFGTTCFSTPLMKVEEIIAETSVITSNFEITLFTDGEPVVNDLAQEMEKISASVDRLGKVVVAINTIGYGNYYNKELLVEMANGSEFGEYIHSSEIDEYVDIFSHNYNRIKDLCVEPIEINAEGKEIIYLASNNARMSKDNLKMRLIERKKNQFVILSDETNFEFTVNGEVFNSADINNTANKLTVANIKYGYAYLNYYNGNRKVALDTLCELRDKNLIDRQLVAFTRNEVADYTKALKKAVFKPSKGRYINGECEENYLPAPDTFCLMDMFNVLIEHNAQYVYTVNYNRIGRKVEDNFNLFRKTDEMTTTDIKSLIFNDKELNISIRSKINGIVKLNPKSAKAVGLNEEIPSYIYRTQTIIKDGNLNMNNITVITDDTVVEILNNKVSDLAKVNDNGTITIDLTKIPVVNQMYINDKYMTADSLLSEVMDSNKLSIQQKVLKYFVASYENPFDYGDKYTEEQTRVLSEHGIDKYGCYVGIDNKMADKVEEDYYTTKNLVMQIKGDASLPSVNAVLKMSKAPTKGMKKYLLDIYEEIKGTTSIVDDPEKYLRDELKKVSRQIIANKVQIGATKIATVLTGNWINGLALNEKGDYEYSNGTDTLVVKANKVKKYY